MFYRAGDWSIVSSTGKSATVGTPTVKIQVGASQISLPIRNDKIGKTINLAGIGVGGSAGVSVETPFTDWFSASISTEDMPSTGVGKIFRKATELNKPYTQSSFEGFMTVATGGAEAAATNGTFSVALWHKNNITNCFVNGWEKCNLVAALNDATVVLNPTGPAQAIYNATHAIGFFTGIEAVTDIMNAGMSMFTYRVSLT